MTLRHIVLHLAVLQSLLPFQACPIFCQAGSVGTSMTHPLVCLVQVNLVAAGIPSAWVSQVLVALGMYLADSPHLEFLLSWLRTVCIRHSKALQNERAVDIMPAIRSMQRVLGKTHQDLAAACDSNLYTLQYLCAAGKNAATQ